MFLKMNKCKVKGCCGERSFNTFCRNCLNKMTFFSRTFKKCPVKCCTNPTIVYCFHSHRYTLDEIDLIDPSLLTKGIYYEL